MGSPVCKLNNNMLSNYYNEICWYLLLSHYWNFGFVCYPDLYGMFFQLGVLTRQSSSSIWIFIPQTDIQFKMMLVLCVLCMECVCCSSITWLYWTLAATGRGCCAAGKACCSCRLDGLEYRHPLKILYNLM